MSARHHLDPGPMPTAEEMAAIHRRLRGPAKVVNLHRPAANRPQEPHDAHVDTYREYLDQLSSCTSPASYLRFLCRLHSVSYDMIVGRSRACEIIAVKHRLIWEVRERFPKLSLPQIGRVFGGLDHTAIIHALKKRGQCSQRNSQFIEREKQAIAMRAEGAEHAEIAAALGCHVETVRYYLNPEYRRYRREKNRRYNESHRIRKQAIERAAGI